MDKKAMQLKKMCSVKYTELLIKKINYYLEENYPDFLSWEGFVHVCERFNEIMFGDAENSRTIFEATVGRYGYDYQDAPTY